MRILHASLMLRMASGHAAQLRDEVLAANALRLIGTVDWETVAIVPLATKHHNSFELVLPPWVVCLRLSKAYFWWYLFARRKKYDYILVRNFAPDPVAWLFAPHISNLVTVHHTKELEELGAALTGLRRSVSLFLEGPVKRYALRRIKFVVGVTPEIARYESMRIRSRPVPLVYRNGIDIGRYSASDLPPAEGVELQALMTATGFHPWHGLDLLLAAMARGHQDAKGRLRLNLVGVLTDDQKRMVSQWQLEDVVVEHGRLSAEELADLMVKMDFAIASLALQRAGLSEGSTLKVREYLGAGLPVYSGHRDAAIHDGFRFYFFDRDGPDVERMIAFGTKNRMVPRGQIRSESESMISKVGAMACLMTEMQSMSGERSPGGKCQ